MASDHILLVDDQQLILASLGEGLRHAGFRVTALDSGAAAIARADEEDFDLALLDMRMPGCSGLDVARWLRAHTAIPFMFLSAHGDAEAVAAAVAEGALCYLVKPLEIPDLVPPLRAALSRAAEIRQLRESRNQLETALSGSRYIAMAVGVLIAREGLSEHDAFQRLRAGAREQSRSIQDVAAELVRRAEPPPDRPA